MGIKQLYIIPKLREWGDIEHMNDRIRTNERDYRVLMTKMGYTLEDIREVYLDERRNID